MVKTGCSSNLRAGARTAGWARPGKQARGSRNSTAVAGTVGASQQGRGFRAAVYKITEAVAEKKWREASISSPAWSRAGKGSLGRGYDLRSWGFFLRHPSRWWKSFFSEVCYNKVPGQWLLPRAEACPMAEEAGPRWASAVAANSLPKLQLRPPSSEAMRQSQQLPQPLLFSCPVLLVSLPLWENPSDKRRSARCPELGNFFGLS